jgi:hypothetical protein
VETNQTKPKQWSYQPKIGKKIQHEQTIQYEEEEITVLKTTTYALGFSRSSGKNLLLQYIKTWQRRTFNSGRQTAQQISLTLVMVGIN